jgi:hypothetical protein
MSQAPTLSRRLCRDRDQETWHIRYAGVHVGTIAERIGNPVGTDAWSWNCGFYPGSKPGDCTTGTAASFVTARVAFELAWSVFLGKRTEADFQEWRDYKAAQAHKRAMWAAGKLLPSQLPNSMMRCHCGALFDSHDPATSLEHRKHIYEHQAKIR